MENWTSRIAVVEHASEQGFWRIDCLTPADRLAPFVRRFNAYAENETGFVRRRELPSGLATLVFNLGQELRVEHPAGTRILRFDHAIRLMRCDQVTSWAELAEACGYADQAHLTRDFRAFAGNPPARFMRRKLPDEGGFVD